MPYILDGRPISPDAAFTAEVNGDMIQFPPGWIRLATEDEKTAIGLTWEPDPAPYDQRFYWGYDQDGALIPKDHTQLVEQWTQQTRTTAGTLLAPTDWQVIREADNGSPVPDDWRTWRESIRTATGIKVAAITATTTTEELAAYVTGPEYSTWPLDPSQPVPEQPADQPAAEA